VPDDTQGNLRRLDRLANLGLISASVAHEIKNGLVAVNTFVEILSEKGEDREMAELVRRELKRIDLLVTQMLRVSSPKPTPKATINIHHVLDRSLRLLEHQMKGQRIALKREYRAVPDQVEADESQLQQAFMNVLLNGIQAIGTNGELAVLTEARPGEAGRNRIQIRIRDTGPGIAAENLPRLFTPFFTTKKDGTGLGLTISERIIREHQGVIEVQSEKGVGTTFTILLGAEN
jgi:signal transduction histidine kinase